MTNLQLRERYVPAIGIETHVQLKTASKLFCRCANAGEAAEPNSQVCPICMGFPGSLPVLNGAAIGLALRIGLALGCQIATETKFDRKHYFYPDLPKGYQISQYDQPIAGPGQLEVPLENKTFTVGIIRAHLEEDAGKLLHAADYSLLDLNRAGTPLVEIVSAPDIVSAAQAKAYVQELYHIMRYAGVSDVDLYRGNMRFDVNVSIRKKGTKELGVRSEIKNLNSFRSVERAVEYEIDRQAELLEKGSRVVQETRGWDDAKGKTISQRSKEEAHDYRYFPEPDIPPLVISEIMLAKAKSELPELPTQIRHRLRQSGVGAAVVETIIGYPDVVTCVQEVVRLAVPPATLKTVVNFLVGVELAMRKTKEGGEPTVRTGRLPAAATLVKLAGLYNEGKVSSTGAKAIYQALRGSAKAEEPATVARRLQLLQVSDSQELTAIVTQVVAANPQAVIDYRSGNTNSLQFLVGQIMKASRGQANPAMAQSILLQQLK
ncbi:Asp-tRNA(Asn)/Glu-tRNA(Gln) amidotransferase subunit GatB [Candidatus Microgenomates bacterium]|nr:Asp-tRNA(Asn)/Glu-tRNA(Gln) amidotransferase subunit GatB [Candidatus Microgenomates bacterium]